jgi:hypothetical protein
VTSAGSADRHLALEQHLVQVATRILTDRSAVRSVTPVAPEVWRLQLDDGGAVIAKHHPFAWAAAGTPRDPLVVEETVLGLLHRAGCPVPAFLGSDPETQVVFLEDLGKETLDDWLQENPCADRAPYARAAVTGVRIIEEALAPHATELEEQVAIGAGRFDLEVAWRSAVPRARVGLAFLLEHAPERRQAAEDLLAAVGDDLIERAPTLGSVDYNARNVILDHDRGALGFIEFSAIGWDWPERRLVQYTTSLGAHRPAGCFAPLLDRASAAGFGEADADLRALDGHRTVFLLNAAGLLAQALAGQADRSTLLAAWTDPNRRIRELLAELVQPWAPDSWSGELGRCFQGVLAPRCEEMR